MLLPPLVHPMNRTRTPIETISEKDSIINSKHHYEHFLKEEIVEDDQDANVDDLEGLQCSKIRIRVKESFQKMPIPPDSIQDNLNLLDMINLGSTNTSRSNGGQCGPDAEMTPKRQTLTKLESKNLQINQQVDLDQQPTRDDDEDFLRLNRIKSALTKDREITSSGTKISSTSNQSAAGQLKRLDKYGNPIKRGGKTHRIVFADNKFVNKPIKEIHEVESYKYENLSDKKQKLQDLINERKKKETTESCNCLIF
eukprot:403336787